MIGEKKVFGFAAEPNKYGIFLTSPATQEADKIICHDVSGFGGSWIARNGSVFFEQEGGGCLCEKAMDKAQKYAKQQNSLIQKQGTK